jgi:hypothetical protein
MLLVAAVLLGIGVLGGAALLLLRFRGGNPPLLFAAVHGTFAGSGLAVLAIAVVADGLRGPPLYALGTLVLAAVLGALLLASHLKGRLIPLTLAVFHGMTAALGYSMLLVHFFS